MATMSFADGVAYSDAALKALKEAEAALPKFRNEGAPSTLAAPSAELLQALMGFPTAAGKPVTRATAVRIVSFLSGCKMIAQDIAKMPLLVRETTLVDGRQHTRPAVNEPLYPLLKDCPNDWQTSYQMRFFLAMNLIMAGNCFCQKIMTVDGSKLLKLIPLNAWNMSQKWDRTDPKQPELFWMYSDGLGNLRRFEQNEIWHVAAMNIDGIGIEGAAIIALAKEALSVLIAAEEAAGRNFANGLGMGGFISFPQGVEITEPQAQDVVDRLKKDFSGSQNAGKFTALPFGGKFEKMTFTPQESQMLESRKWNAEEVIRLLGGAPLLVKLGMGDKNTTYASSSAFLDEYYNTTLSPYCINIEQSITRDLIAPKDRTRLTAKHDSWVILRGSPKERAEYYKDRIGNGSMSPNQAAVLEDEDTIDGFGDYRFFPANSAYFDPETGMAALAGQATPTPNPEETTLPAGDEDEKSLGGTPPPAKVQNIADYERNARLIAENERSARLKKVLRNAVDRCWRKEEKAGSIDIKFLREVLDITSEQAEQYIQKRKSGEIKDNEGARRAMYELVLQGEK